MYAYVGSAGASIGVFVGGLLTQTLGSSWVFYVNLPIGVVIVALALRVLPTGNGLGLAAGADLVGSALVTAGLMLGVYTIVRTADVGWTSASTLGFGALSIALLTAFVVDQSRAANPQSQSLRRERLPGVDDRRDDGLPVRRRLPAARSRL